MKSIARIGLLAIVTLSPAFALAQYPGSYTQESTTVYTDGGFFNSIPGFGGVGGDGSLAGIAETVLFVINKVFVPVIFAVAFIVFLYGIAKAYIFSIGDYEEVEKGHTLMLWGIIAFVVMISIWGIVNVVTNTFGIGGYRAPYTPSSSPANGSGGLYGSSRPPKSSPVPPTPNTNPSPDTGNYLPGAI